jgi:hypothetical protein
MTTSPYDTTYSLLLVLTNAWPSSVRTARPCNRLGWRRSLALVQKVSFSVCVCLENGVSASLSHLYTGRNGFFLFLPSSFFFPLFCVCVCVCVITLFCVITTQLLQAICTVARKRPGLRVTSLTRAIVLPTSGSLSFGPSGCDS